MQYVSVAWSRLLSVFCICVIRSTRFPSPSPSPCSESYAPTPSRRTLCLQYCLEDCYYCPLHLWPSNITFLHGLRRARNRGLSSPRLLVCTEFSIVSHKRYAEAGNILYDSGPMIVDFERAELCSRSLPVRCLRGEMYVRLTS